MIVEPKIRGFLCTTAHPEGCKQNVINQIEFATDNLRLVKSAPKNVLVIGASTGYGLASRIAASVGYKSNTLGVIFERPPTEKKTASPGWYNTAALEEYAAGFGNYNKTINGDAFSDEVKKKVIDEVKSGAIGKFDLIVYSLASPRRKDPRSNQSYSSVLKPIDKKYSSKTVDFNTGIISDVAIDPANDEELANTIKVMGGEDWLWWIEDLLEADVLADGVKTLAYSYVGPELTHPIYRNGTIGKAKEDLEAKAKDINSLLKEKGQAFVSVNKAVVTQASAAIPVVPLYLSLLLKVMKEKNIHEDCIEQIVRMFNDRVYGSSEVITDLNDLIRLDDLEMKKDIQESVFELWKQVSTDNLEEISDISGYRKGFYNLFGFDVDGVDYSQDVDIQKHINTLDL